MQRTTRRIAIASQKGGVGKTTTAWNVAAGLTAKGRDVLVVDLDGQCHLTTGVLGTPPARSLWDVLAGTMPAHEAVVPGAEFDLLPASEMLSRADYDLGGRPGRDFLLSRALKGRRDPASNTRAPGVQDDYDYIILDCPPSLGIMTANALAYASEVIVPVTPGLFAVSGLGMLGSVIAETIDAGVNEDLAISGILLTQYESGTGLHRSIASAVEEQFPGLLYPLAIRKNVAVGEAHAEGRSVLSYAPKSHGAADYTELVEYLIKQEG
jgi:chromosome partitioning protein